MITQTDTCWLDWEKGNILGGWIRSTSDGNWVVTVKRTSRSAKNRWQVVLSVADDEGQYTRHHRYFIKDKVDDVTAQSMAMAFAMGRMKKLTDA